MTNKDHKLVNLSEDYELNRHLKKANKRETKENREKLKEIAIAKKTQLNKRTLTHKELSEALKSKQKNLEPKSIKNTFL